MNQRFFALFIILISCNQGPQGPAEKPESPKESLPEPHKESLAAKLEQAHKAKGESNISCKEGSDGGVTYIGCRWDGNSDAATVWHVDGQTVNAINGKALQMVSKLSEPWIKEGPRPAPPGVDVAAGLRVTR